MKQPIYYESATKHFPFKIDLSIGYRTIEQVLNYCDPSHIRFPKPGIIRYVYADNKGLTALRRAGLASTVKNQWEIDQLQVEKTAVTMA